MLNFIKGVLFGLGILSFISAIPIGFITYYLGLLTSDQSVIIGVFIMAQGVTCIVSSAIIEENI